MPLQVEWALFYSLSALTLAGLLLWFLIPGIRRFNYRFRTVPAYFRTVNRVVLDNDYLLVNAFESGGPDDTYRIDHIMIGDKYVYVICDYYYPGALRASEKNNCWVYYHGKKQDFVPNPLLKNDIRIQRLLSLGFDSQMIIGIVLLNDDCMISDISYSHDNYVCSLKQFPKVIKDIEGRDVAPLNVDQALRVARDFASLNKCDDVK